MTGRLINIIITSIAPGVNPNYSNALKIVKVARTSFNNMRFKFMEVVKELASSYITKHAR
jgi:hypothetical protein